MLQLTTQHQRPKILLCMGYIPLRGLAGRDGDVGECHELPPHLRQIWAARSIL
jgi:hypothetical protein